MEVSASLKQRGTTPAEQNLLPWYTKLFSKGATLKGKNLFPWGANPFLEDWFPLRRKMNIFRSK